MITGTKAKTFDFVRGKGKRERKQTGGNIYVATSIGESTDFANFIISSKSFTLCFVMLVLNFTGT